MHRAMNRPIDVICIMNYLNCLYEDKVMVLFPVSAIEISTDIKKNVYVCLLCDDLIY
jgi:hypothetical protein